MINDMNISNWLILYKRKIIIVVLLLIVVVGVIIFVRSKNKNIVDFVVAKRGEIIQEVSVTGKVKPSQNVDLAFENSGKVSSVYFDVGDFVSKGQMLIRLESADIFADLYRAEANLEAEVAKLDELKKGKRSEEVAVYEAKVESARQSLEDTRKILAEKLNDAYIKSDDAVRNRSDQFISNPRGSSPQLNFVTDSKIENDIETGRVDVENALVLWKSSLDDLSATDDISATLNLSKNTLSKVVNFLNNVAMAVNGLTSTSNLSQTTIDSYKSSIATARTNVNTSIDNLSLAEESFRNANSSLSVSKRELDLANAGGTEGQIKNQEAIVKSYQASVSNYNAQIAKRMIVSPISGVVTKQEAKVGEIIGANVKVVSVISGDKFEIEVNVPEADIAKVNIGDVAKVTLDAYGNDIYFDADIIKIDPAETIVEGVSVYKTTLQFLKRDDLVRSGMTANVDIITERKDSVVILPQRAVISKNGDRFVKILKEDNTVEDRKVVTGIIDNSGQIEIVEGLKGDEKVLLNI